MFFKIDGKAASLEIILSFAKKNYPDLSLQPAMLEQLLWLQANSVNTSQSNVQVNKEDVNIEVKRILARLYCFKLLMDGSLSAYLKFTQAQKNTVQLSNAHFKRLSCFIQDLSEASHESLLATCFITKSDEAIKNVPNEQREELPVDSEQFISYMASNFSHVFPICSLITKEAVELLPFAFHQGSHARYMLDMEGGNNMFSSLKQAIGSRTMSYEQYNLWFARWIINIAGLDGHLNCNGSVYLTAPVARGIWALKSGLDQLWLNPNYPVIDDYLAFRQRELQVDNTYVAYLGALMRKYEPTDGVAIQMWFDGLNSEVQREKIQAFNTQLNQITVTPTFKPTVNLLMSGLRPAFFNILPKNSL